MTIRKQSREDINRNLAAKRTERAFARIVKKKKAGGILTSREQELRSRYLKRARGG